MLTWRLWRALRYPDDDKPLFARVQAQPSTIPGRKLIQRLDPIMNVLTTFMSAALVVVAPLVLPALANLLGGLIAFNIPNTINREREGGTYDLLALTPSGLGVSNWQIAAACTARLNMVERLASLRTLSLLTVGLLFAASLSYALVLTPLALVLGLMALNVDAIQSILVGCLSGMLAQEFSRRSATFASVAIFIFVQLILVYLPVALLTIALLGLLRPLPLDRWLSEGIVAAVALLVLSALRELIIRLMWRALERRLL